MPTTTPRSCAVPWGRGGTKKKVIGRGRGTKTTKELKTVVIYIFLAYKYNYIHVSNSIFV